MVQLQFAVCTFRLCPQNHPSSNRVASPPHVRLSAQHLTSSLTFASASGFIFSPCLARWLPPSAEPCSAASRPGWPMRPVPSYRPSYNGQVPYRCCKSPANASKRRPGQSNYLLATGANAVALMSGHQVDRTMHARCPFSGIWPLSAPGRSSRKRRSRCPATRGQDSLPGFSLVQNAVNFQLEPAVRPSSETSAECDETSACRTSPETRSVFVTRCHRAR